MIKIIIKFIVLNFYKIYLRIKKNVIIKFSSHIGINTKFEDSNIINNNSSVVNSFVGRGTYIGENSICDNTKVGRFCSIGNNLNVIDGNHPTKEWVSTHPAFYSIKKQAGFSFVSSDKLNLKKKINGSNYICSIGNDVWIGDNVTILQGVYIADGSVIGACAVVTKNTEPYGIYAGVPAKKISSRFEKEEIDFLESFKWWNKDLSFMMRYSDYFSNFDKFYEKFGGNLRNENHT